MPECKNLMGLNLSINEDVISSAVKESIISGIAASLSNSNELVHEFVKQILTDRVRVSDGQPKQYGSDATCTRMEYFVRKAIEEETKSEIAKMIDDMRPQISCAVRSEFLKHDVVDGFVGMFMDSLKNAIGNKYHCDISATFAQENDY